MQPAALSFGSLMRGLIIQRSVIYFFFNLTSQQSYLILMGAELEPIDLITIRGQPATN
jgi:hypothetical protein